jgi:hypothetical protein
MTTGKRFQLNPFPGVTRYARTLAESLPSLRGGKPCGMTPAFFPDRGEPGLN